MFAQYFAKEPSDIRPTIPANIHCVHFSVGMRLLGVPIGRYWLWGLTNAPRPEWTLYAPLPLPIFLAFKFLRRFDIRGQLVYLSRNLDFHRFALCKCPGNEGKNFQVGGTAAGDVKIPLKFSDGADK